jgi:hypothetical protein
MPRTEPSRRPGVGPRHETHAERAARLDTLELERRLRRLERSQRVARGAIEDELRREHWGRLPEGWHEPSAA